MTKTNLIILLSVFCLTAVGQTRVNSRQVADWSQVQPLVGVGSGTQLSVEQLQIDPTTLTKWRYRVVGPCITYASIAFAPGSGPILVTGMGSVNIEGEKEFYRNKAIRKFWFRVP